MITLLAGRRRTYLRLPRDKRYAPVANRTRGRAGCVARDRVSNA